MNAITRRRFAACSAGLISALSLPRIATSAAAQTVSLSDGTVVPALGQGSARLGQGRHPLAEEEQAMSTGLSLGMTLIDTAEIYGDGKAEQLIGRVIKGRREEVFLVSKVWPSHATRAGIQSACSASLARLGTDHLDLYLLHWPDRVKDLAEVVGTFEQLRAGGQIWRWGVSNFGVAELDRLFRIPAGEHCATNQVSYSLADRKVERDVLPWCVQHRMPIMAYSPLGGEGSRVLRNPAVQRIASSQGQSSAAVALAWAMRSGNVIAIPESGSVAHVRENAAALTLRLGLDELRQLDQAFPA
ncbi:aldo/keto reductase [Methylobacterium nodulans]|uniref:Aldo/keto reductase n=1 Tax=Methylobacterium nodulans (strain LMG 21967 / CNCM I-2342 / ORS 2060) TaxID=460265 RepID=B8IM82_METNO|nr:aldo/keto reductase [Methylobacterium nodulans]ACL58268.1 aldo/keto reductase [Methylobacterium nodulans ORS 2060]